MRSSSARSGLRGHPVLAADSGCGKSASIRGRGRRAAERRCLESSRGERRQAMADSFGALGQIDAGGPVARDRAAGRARRGDRRLAAAVHAADPAREPPPPRGRRDGHADDIEPSRAGTPRPSPHDEIAFTPARVSSRTSRRSGVVDLAAMRDAMATSAATRRRSTRCSRPSWSSTTRYRSTSTARAGDRKNAELEFERNRERYALLRWGQQAFDNFRSSRPTPASSTR